MKSEIAFFLGGLTIGVIAVFLYLSPSKDEIAPVVPTPAIPVQPHPSETVKRIIFTDAQNKVNMQIYSEPTPIIEIKDKKGQTRKLDLVKLIERIP